MLNVKISKRQTTQYNHFCKVRDSLYDLFRQTQTFQLNFNEYLELKKKKFTDHPSRKKLNQYYTGCLSGIESTFFHLIQTEKVEWLHSYKTRSGNTIYKKSWEQVPLSYRKKPQRKIQSNHYWKNPKDKNNPKPWGTEPSIF
jgi:hypothetical protein